MVFFQAALLAGYAYAHLLTRYAPGRRSLSSPARRDHPRLLHVATLDRKRLGQAACRRRGHSGLLGLFAVSIGLPVRRARRQQARVEAWFARRSRDRRAPKVPVGAPGLHLDERDHGDREWAVLAAFGREGTAEYLSVVDVTNDRMLMPSQNIAAVAGGPGIGFCGLHLARDATLVTLAHCEPPIAFKAGPAAAAAGNSPNVPDGDRRACQRARPPGRRRGCHAMVARLRSPPRPLRRYRHDDRRQGWAARRADQRTGRELQRIETKAYRSGRFSSDGRWLMLLDRDDDAISVYAAEP